MLTWHWLRLSRGRYAPGGAARAWRTPEAPTAQGAAPAAPMPRQLVTWRRHPARAARRRRRRCAARRGGATRHSRRRRAGCAARARRSAQAQPARAAQRPCALGPHASPSWHCWRRRSKWVLTLLLTWQRLRGPPPAPLHQRARLGPARRARRARRRVQMPGSVARRVARLQLPPPPRPARPPLLQQLYRTAAVPPAGSTPRRRIL